MKRDLKPDHYHNGRKMTGRRYQNVGYERGYRALRETRYEIDYHDSFPKVRFDLIAERRALTINLVLMEVKNGA
ncbi:MAG: hypothetical protein GY771_04760 [bacterium]|nr:hypothetical protein [bacterium]